MKPDDAREKEHRYPPPEAHTPQQRLDNEMQRFLQTHRNTMRRYFQSCGMFNGHPHMLFHLHFDPGLTQRELAARMRVAPATLSVSVKRLEAAGLIYRRADERDARVTHLFLTEKGEAMDRRCREGRDFLIDTLYRDFSEDDLQTLSSLLGRMTSNLEHSWPTLPQPDESDILKERDETL